MHAKENENEEMEKKMPSTTNNCIKHVMVIVKRKTCDGRTKSKEKYGNPLLFWYKTEKEKVLFLVIQRLEAV